MIDDRVEELFSKYKLKTEFGTEYKTHADSMRVYKINDEYVMFEPVNENQFRVYFAYKQTYDSIMEMRE